MYGKPGIKAVHQKLHLVKSVEAKNARFFFFWVCANVGVFFRLEILPQACQKGTYKIDFSFSNFGLGVSHSQKCYVMFQYHLTETKETELWIDLLSVAFFDQAALFSDFNHFFSITWTRFCSL